MKRALLDQRCRFVQRTRICAAHDYPSYTTHHTLPDTSRTNTSISYTRAYHIRINSRHNSGMPRQHTPTIDSEHKQYKSNKWRAHTHTPCCKPSSSSPPRLPYPCLAHNSSQRKIRFRWLPYLQSPVQLPRRGEPRSPAAQQPRLVLRSRWRLAVFLPWSTICRHVST